MTIYSIDIRVYATAYIRADSEEEAQKIADELKNTALYVQDAVNEGYEGENDIPISGLRYDDPDLPDVSLSPCMTIHGPDENETVEEADV